MPEIIGTPPAAGADFVWINNAANAPAPLPQPPIAIPRNLESIIALLTASVTVANRFLQIKILDAIGNLLAVIVNQTAVVASTSVNVTAYQGATQQNSASGTVQLPLPQNLPVPVNGSIVLTGEAAGDTWTNIILVLS